MNKSPSSFEHLTTAIRELQPPRRHNKHSPRFQAQQTMVELAATGPVTLSEAEWRALPKGVKVTALKRLRLPGGDVRYLFANQSSAPVVVYRWLCRCGWRPPRTLASHPRGPGLKQDGVYHG